MATSTLGTISSYFNSGMPNEFHLKKIYIQISTCLLTEINSSNCICECGVAGPILGADVCISGSFKLKEVRNRDISFIGPRPEWSRVCVSNALHRLALSIIDFELC